MPTLARLCRGGALVYIAPVNVRTLSLSLAALALLLAACGGGSSSGPACPATCTLGCDADGNCLQGLSCAVPVQTSTDLTAQRLGSHRVGDVVDFTVPPGTASVTIVEQAVKTVATVTYEGAALPNTAIPNWVKNPSGKIIYDDSPTATPDAAANESAEAFFASSSPVTGTLTIPDTTGGLALAASGLPAGTWSLRVSDYAWECTWTENCAGGTKESVYDVTVVTKPLLNGALPSSGVLDVVFWFVADSADSDGGVPGPLSESTAAADPDLVRLTGSLRSILADAGVTLGGVTFRDLPARVQQQYATGVDVSSSGACAELPQLLTYAGEGSALNVFLVSSFISTASGGNDIVGIDGTIPGPATLPGTVASGVAVSVADLRHRSADPVCQGAPAYDWGGLSCGADSTAYIVAHEAGHFLGLYHTTESGGDSFDPIADTGRCPCTSCAPLASRSTCGTATSSAYGMRVADCNGSVTGCGGGDNLMFYLLDSGAQATLTPQQRQVILANPLIR